MELDYGELHTVHHVRCEGRVPVERGGIPIDIGNSNKKGFLTYFCAVGWVENVLQ